MKCDHDDTSFSFPQILFCSLSVHFNIQLASFVQHISCPVRFLWFMLSCQKQDMAASSIRSKCHAITALGILQWGKWCGQLFDDVATDCERVAEGALTCDAISIPPTIWLAGGCTETTAVFCESPLGVWQSTAAPLQPQQPASAPSPEAVTRRCSETSSSERSSSRRRGRRRLLR